MILVEAKAHVDEMLSPPSMASAESLKQIRKALNATKRFFKAKTEREWHAAIKVMHEALGIRGKLQKKYVIDLFVDVGGLG